MLMELLLVSSSDNMLVTASAWRDCAALLGGPVCQPA